MRRLEDRIALVTGAGAGIGAATAIVVGLVAVTPAAGFVSPLAAIVIGCLAAIPSYYALLLRARTRLDDSLDVVAAHGVGGVVGALLTGVFADKQWNLTVNGALFGNARQLGIQIVAVLATIAFSAAVTLVILKTMALVMRIRVSAHEEGIGLDVSQHGEAAYTRGEGAVLILPAEKEMIDETSASYRTA